ncbi:putative amino acid aldolase or racemase [Burkholderia sp. Ch1-1]|uniref:D-threo-3-hydroxyaspartate dehydratase n=1 Tax=Paraburkholderia dioscoreae TaxID=2604047 RepID=A0A5Q4ZBQ8_9BURK|nr:MULTISPECIES: alanine racemase [Paraburkholderia]EIF33539.1 putative amino acid aldolase or racemase [Burkholderia sp. Ch1-1]MDR8395690.1 alanine racemase [Paraburkholderia sp. USG1]VVD32399.1 D-threo-3-hydroxyaspartate dehydratase [Paraburkholderia dioscoreae]
MKLDQIETPAALIDIARMQKNIARMQGHMNALGVAFRPHVKTTKCIDVVRAQIAAGARGITVSTLKEAEAFFAAGAEDILYAVSMAPSKLPRALALRRQGCDLKLVVDNPNAAAAIAAFSDQHGQTFEVWIEVDTDGHRSGITPEQDTLLEVGRILHENGVKVGGVMTHAGSSYELDTPEALAALAEQERAGCVRAAQRLREAGIACPAVSVGSTPTALAATQLEGVTEVRAGVYVLFDLVMHNVGVCALDDIALSVLATVIGHQADKGWAILDAGWMAMSRDRGTSKQSHDFGYGQPCLLNGTPLPGYVISAANQEHGILSATAEHAHTGEDITQRFPIGMKLRVLPNHACATGAQFPEYHAVTPDGDSVEWRRFHGW